MQDLNPVELNRYLQSNAPLLLDVREPWEWEKCHLKNAKLLPIGQIMQNIDTLDKTQTVVLICHHGIRSMQVARYFESIGFDDVVNLRGGIDAWAKQVDATMPLY